MSSASFASTKTRDGGRLDALRATAFMIVTIMITMDIITMITIGGNIIVARLFG